MIKKKKLMVLTAVICCFLFSVTALAATNDSKGWNVYNSSGTAYANVGVTYVSDTFEGKAIVSYVARALGQDAADATATKKARIVIYDVKNNVVVDETFDYDNMTKGTKKISDSNSYVRVVVTIDNGRGTQDVYLD